ncbi:hypothetical protein KFE25_012132 [Diacronema lutheri]|uniref:tRNA-binding domain-containing protein n=1 Tax=Diacronema lutheri TaxID=2081491 RepID=A0A8J5XEI6_DIALT|nr:hypothetical protein KFE25_012132 [Diacronema lutheri]
MKAATIFLSLPAPLLGLRGGWLGSAARPAALARSRLADAAPAARMCSAPPAEDEAPPKFSTLDVRVGRIVEAWAHPDSEKLFCERIDVGEAQPREIASGLRAHYKLEQLADRLVLVVCNLKPAKLAGFESNGMVFCASSADKGKVEFVDPPEGAQPGARVLALAEAAAPPADVEPASSNQMKKKKLLEKMSAGLRTDAGRVATYLGEPLVVRLDEDGTTGQCTAPTVAGGSIS